MITKFNTTAPTSGGKSSKGSMKFVLLIGLLVAGYFGYKYYKDKQDETTS